MEKIITLKLMLEMYNIKIN